MCLQDRVADNLEFKGLEIRHDQRRVYVDQSEEGIMLTNQSEGARNSTNQSLPPECACAVPS